MATQNWVVRFDLERADTIRRRTRAYAFLVCLLWVPLSLFADPLLFGATRAGLWLRVPTGVALALLGIWLQRPRRRWVIEVVASLVFCGVWIELAAAVVLCTPATTTATMMSVAVGAMATSTALALSWRATAVVCLVANLAILVAGLAREPRPDETYFFLVLFSFVMYPLLIFTAVLRDRGQRAEFEGLQKLQKANEDLRREQDARSRLFVNLSHDFRTPLAVVRAEVELLRRQGADDVVLARGLERIDSNAKSIVDLIEQLLELARLDAAKMPVSPIRCDLPAMAREIAARLAPSRTDIALTVQTVGPTPFGQVDPLHMRRILQNLIGNGLREVATHGGSVCVVIGSDAAGAPIIDVVDDGAGIALEARATLFERFSSFRPEGGTISGIGLALTRELAELNGGSLHLVEEAQRTTFRLRLPAGGCPSASEAADIPVPKPPGKPAGRFDEPRLVSTQVSGQPVRPFLIVVEDNDDLRASLGRLLGARFEVEAVGTFAEARAAISRRIPAALVCDIMLPDGDGYDLLAAVRQRRGFERVPVILVSALGETVERVRGLSAGADDYVTKPFSGEELGARISAAIDRATEQAEQLTRQREDMLMELHDGVCGNLARAVIELSSVTAQHRDDPSIATAVTSIREGLAEARALLAALAPTPRPWQEVMTHLRWELAGACDRGGLVLDFSDHQDGAGSCRMSPPIVHALQRMASEALTNTLRHASATRVRVRLEARGSSIHLRFEDNGSGTSAVFFEGRGLDIVRRRTSRLGGEVSFGNGPAGGFVIEAKLPALG